MPDPKQNESKNDFIKRCMGDPESVRSYPDQSQRYAVCNSKWMAKALKKVKKKPKY